MSTKCKAGMLQHVTVDTIMILNLQNLETPQVASNGWLCLEPSDYQGTMPLNLSLTWENSATNFSEEVNFNSSGEINSTETAVPLHCYTENGVIPYPDVSIYFFKNIFLNIFSIIKRIFSTTS